MAEIIDPVLQIDGGVRRDGGQKLIHIVYMDHAVSRDLGGAHRGFRLFRFGPDRVSAVGEGGKLLIRISVSIRGDSAFALLPVLQIPAAGAAVVRKGAVIHNRLEDRAEEHALKGVAADVAAAHVKHLGGTEIEQAGTLAVAHGGVEQRKAPAPAQGDDAVALDAVDGAAVKIDPAG